MPFESSAWQNNVFSIAHRKGTQATEPSVLEIRSGPISGQALQQLLDVSKSFVGAQLAFNEDLDSVLVCVHLLCQSIYPLGQVSHSIRHHDLRGEQLLLGREQTFVAVN